MLTKKGYALPDFFPWERWDNIGYKESGTVAFFDEEGYRWIMFGRIRHANIGKDHTGDLLFLDLEGDVFELTNSCYVAYLDDIARVEITREMKIKDLELQIEKLKSGE